MPFCFSLFDKAFETEGEIVNESLFLDAEDNTYCCIDVAHVRYSSEEKILKFICATHQEIDPVFVTMRAEPFMAEDITQRLFQDGKMALSQHPAFIDTYPPDPSEEKSGGSQKKRSFSLFKMRFITPKA